MSAYVVNSATMQAVVHAIARYASAFPGYALPAWPDVTAPEAGAVLSRLGTDLWTMNASAVKQRYYQAPEPALPPFRFDPTLAPTPAQMRGSIECLVYQCSEGNVPDSRLFLALERAEADVARAINVDGEWGVMDLAAIPRAEPAVVLTNAPDEADAIDGSTAARLRQLDLNEAGERQAQAMVSTDGYGI